MKRSSSAHSLVPMSSDTALDVIRSVTSKWNDSSPISDTLFETNQLIQQMSKDDFEENVDKLSDMLENSRSDNGKKIFQNRSQVERYLREVRKKGSKSKYSTKRIKPIETENEYSRDLSPMMKRSRLENSVAKSMFFKNEI